MQELCRSTVHKLGTRAGTMAGRAMAQCIFIVMGLGLEKEDFVLLNSDVGAMQSHFVQAFLRGCELSPKHLN